MNLQHDCYFNRTCMMVASRGRVLNDEKELGFLTYLGANSIHVARPLKPMVLLWLWVLFKPSRISLVVNR